MADDAKPTDVMEQLPAGGNVNRPESGSYGEVADLERLQESLPGDTGAQPQDVEPLPPMGSRPPEPNSPELPPDMFAPTARPDIPGSTPLTPQPQIAQDPKGQRMQLLESLAQSPNVSDSTRQIARRILDSMIR